MERRWVPSGTGCDRRVEYSKTVRVDPDLNVSGRTATDEDGELLGREETEVQVQGAFSNGESAFERAGAEPSPVVRTWGYDTDVERSVAIDEVHG